jgi:FKBP-type peptidyl-prolyl cis-trans isomerase FkpA
MQRSRPGGCQVLTTYICKMKTMLKYVLFFSLITLIATACLKTNKTSGCPYTSTTGTAPQNEQDSVKAYLDTNHLTATKHAKGFYYEIVNAGAPHADSLNYCTQISITYSGKLVNGTEFDKQTNYKFVLGTLIDGWKDGIPLIGKGGRIKLYIPPSLGYGNNDIRNSTGAIVIPKNSILIFDISLIDYSNN